MLDRKKIEASLNRTIMTGDHMYDHNNPDYYFSVGWSAMVSIYSAMCLANKSEVGSVLDFACGSGRVTRWLKAAFPDALVVASDLREDSLCFIEKEFDAKPWLSNVDIYSLEPSVPFDVIWCGSLLTHLSKEGASEVISKFCEWLKPGGVAVFTTHGRGVISRQDSGRSKYIDEEKYNNVLTGLNKFGYGYEDYSNRAGIGFSISTLSWAVNKLTRRDDVRLLMAGESLWANHHDVIGIWKKPVFDYS